MPTNLLDVLRSYFSPQIIALISGLLGENTDKTQTAVDGALPALIGGLIQQSLTDQGVNDLASDLDQDDDDLLDDLTKTLSGSSHQALMVEGGGLLSTLFSGNARAVASSISDSSGIPQPTCMYLLGLLTPIVMAVLGQEKRRANLSTAGLSELLSDQKQSLSGWLPAGVGNVLGLGAIGDSTIQMLHSGLSNGLGAVQETAASATDSSRDAISTATETAQDAVTGAAATVRGVFSGPTEAASDITSAATDTAQDAVSEVTNAANDLTSNAADMAQDAVSSGADIAQSASESAQDMAADAVETIQPTASEATDTARDATSNATDAARNILFNTADAAGDLASDVVDSIQETANSITEMTPCAVADTLEVAQETLFGTAEAAQERVESGQGAVTGATEAAQGPAAATAGAEPPPDVGVAAGSRKY